MKRQPATRKAQKGRQVTDIYSWPAPTKGWYDSESIADMPEGSAYVLNNWFPETTSLQIRAGFTQFARLLGPGEDLVASLQQQMLLPFGVVWQSKYRHNRQGRLAEPTAYLIATSGAASRFGGIGEFLVSASTPIAALATTLLHATMPTRCGGWSALLDATTGMADVLGFGSVSGDVGDPIP